jgi:NAD(P)-dependent dehydrogenase (short-subunit alcohol dehydrogenase family)
MDVVDQTGGGYDADEDIEGRVPMGRFATAEDVARAVAFLADPEQSAFVSGHTLSVDGGWYGDGAGRASGGASKLSNESVPRC